MRLALAVLLVATPALADRSVKDAPRDLASEVTIAADDEPGERLILGGTVLGAGGKPAAGATVYAYHTDEKGSYGRGARDPRLFGYARTDRAGRFTLRTIRPGSYPTGRFPAHIHVEIAHRDRVHVDECWFAGDPHLTDETRKHERERGALSRILELRRDGKSWRGEWTIAIH